MAVGTLGVISGLSIAALAGRGEGARPSVAPSSAPISSHADTVPNPTPSARLQNVSRSVATPAVPQLVDPPVAVRVPDADIGASVVPVGVAPDGQMELPPDPDVVGWYRYGPPAGSGTGSVVLAGHVDSRRYGVGELASLRDVDVGAEVIVVTGSGKDLRYRVVDIGSTPKSELPLAEIFRRDGAERLLLITCGGEFDRAGNGYTDNVVVIAVPA